MWQFAEAVRGLADGCLELGMPVTGGNVSFYNQTGDDADPPDAGRRRARRASTTSRRRTPIGFAGRRATSCCCSARPRDELGGSEWAHVVHGHLGGLPPGSTSPPSGALAEVLVGRGRRRAARRRARPVRRRPGPGAGRVVPARRDRRSRTPARMRRPVRRAVLRVGPGRGRRRARAASTPSIALCGRHRVPVTRLGTTGGADLVAGRPVHGAGRGAARGLAGHVPRPVRLTTACSRRSDDRFRRRRGRRAPRVALAADELAAGREIAVEVLARPSGPG